MESLGRGADWHSSCPSSCKHTFPCPLSSAACMKHFWGGHFGDCALELFVWLPLYYDCFPFYKYYLNIMMRNKNKTKNTERWKRKTHHPFFFLREQKNKTILGLYNRLQLYTQRSTLTDRCPAPPWCLDTCVCFACTQGKAHVNRMEPGSLAEMRRFPFALFNGAKPVDFMLLWFWFPHTVLERKTASGVKTDELKSAQQPAFVGFVSWVGDGIFCSLVNVCETLQACCDLGSWPLEVCMHILIL